MRNGLTSVCLLCIAIGFAQPAGARNLPEGLLAAHWHPATLEQARNRTLAAAAWLERDASAEDWPQALDAIVLRIEPAMKRVGPLEPALMDGLMAWLVRQRQVNLGTVTGFPAPELADIDDLLGRDHSAGMLARLRVVAAFRAAAIWRRVADALGEEGADAMAEYWAPLAGELETAQSDESAEALDYARRQAGRVLELASAESSEQRLRKHDAILLAQAQRAWQAGRLLDAVWTAFEGLARLTQAGAEQRDMALAWSQWLDGLDGEAGEPLRSIDVDLPVVLALLGDAAGYMASPERATQSAFNELADAYARLALFAPDLAFYLDQPVREPVRRAVANCNPDPLLVGPLPRDVFERCANNLDTLLAEGLGSEELVGGGQGPFAAEFLRRELGLVSWQRAAYLDGHLAWMLEAQCRPPDWVNVLEWSLLADHLVRWVAQRPVFFTGSTRRELADRLAGRMRDQGLEHVEWIDCLTGQGRRRLDPVTRLIDRHRSALASVSELLREARDAFYAGVTRPGADVDLDGPADQLTAYRPEGLAVGPCPEARTCGARVDLPASRALLSKFPNAFLLADQIGMGEIALCYDQVRWVERSRRPARDGAAGVAAYDGRLSFDLVGQFRGGDGQRTVFRYRLTDNETRQYLFAADDDAILEQDCPIDRVGGSVASSLPDDHPGLVPNRLTYFVSAPTVPEARMVANWNRGAEWRDWFVTGQRVTEIQAADAASMEVAVQAELAALVARRERQLTAPLINPPRAGDADPLVQAMARVSDTAALLRRVLELHYPRIIRQYAPVRSLLVGESGLMSRDRVRLMRDRGIPAIRMPGIGRERAGRLREVWRDLPLAVREQGQRAPEIDFSLERLVDLRARSGR